MKKIKLFVAMLLSVITLSSAKAYTVATMYKSCLEIERISIDEAAAASYKLTSQDGICVGHFGALYSLLKNIPSAALVSHGVPNICMPANFTIYHLIFGFQNFVRANPDNQKEDSLRIALIALYKMYPCRAH